MSKIKYIGKCRLNNDIIDKEEKELEDLYESLSSHNFYNYLPLIKRIDNRNNYQYIKDKKRNSEELSYDMGKVVGLLHSKTSYIKRIRKSNYDDIYYNTKGYINYVKTHYNNILNDFESLKYPTPTSTLFLKNYTILDSLFSFLDKEIEEYYKLVKDKEKMRLVTNHGNLKDDHFLLDDKLYLISWGNYNIDSPISDLINFYKNSYNKIDFDIFLKEYTNTSKLNNDELKLFLINISIPNIYKIEDNEIINITNFTNLFDYIEKTSSLVRPYYTIEKKEE